MKKITFVSALVCAIFFSFNSCSSNGLLVPGETDIILKNLATEYYNLAEGYMEVKKYDKAAEYYLLSMRNEELYMTSYYKLARSYALAKNWEKAEECYKALLEKDPVNNQIKASLAYISAMSGNTDEAIIQYKKLIEDNPYDENLLESYVALLINVGRGEDAEKTFFVLKEKFPDNKQLTSFAQQLSDIVDNFDTDKKSEVPAKSETTASQ